MGFFQFFSSLFDSAFFISRDLLTIIFQLLLGLEHKAVGLVQLIYFLTFSFIGGFIGFCLCLHAFYFIFAETRTRFDMDLLFFTGAFVFCRYMQDTISINIKDHFDLWYTTGSRWNIREIKAAQALVLISHRAFALENMDFHSGLVIAGG